MSLTLKDPISIEDVKGDVDKAREDNDPQAIFYLNPVPAAPTAQRAQHASEEGVSTTFYSWATKIEHTVQSNLGKGSDPERHSLQASWGRAAYRAKLLDYLARTTPWLMVRDSSDAFSHEGLTGEYHHDKLVYQKPIREFLQAKLPQIPGQKVRIIERYIAETMVLGQDGLAQVCRFALALPLLEGTGPVQSGLRVILFAFERKAEGEGGKKVEISATMYEAGLDQKLFDEQKFSQDVLDSGRELVSDATLDLLS